jgi:diguanylate cyclase (GGDEF)-like protein
VSPDDIHPRDDEAQRPERAPRRAPQPDLDRTLTRVLRLATQALSVDTATLKLVDREAPRFAAVHGQPAGVDLDQEFAALASAALAGPDVFEAPDPVLDAECGPGRRVRWYAAAPFGLASGRPLGLLEVVGWTPRSPLDETERQTLLDLAAIAGDVLEADAVRADLEAVRRELERHLDHDPLTGALTRRGLIDRLEHALSLVHRTEATLTVVLLERPGLRMLGDRAHVEIVERLRVGLRDHDLVAQWGADAFAVVLQAGDGVSEPSVARRLAQDVGRPVPHETDGPPVHVSVGMATYPHAGEDALGLLGAAATALVAAKRRGGGVAEAPGALDAPSAV